MNIPTFDYVWKPKPGDQVEIARPVKYYVSTYLIGTLIRPCGPDHWIVLIDGKHRKYNTKRLSYAPTTSQISRQCADWKRYWDESDERHHRSIHDGVCQTLPWRPPRLTLSRARLGHQTLKST